MKGKSNVLYNDYTAKLLNKMNESSLKPNSFTINVKFNFV